MVYVNRQVAKLQRASLRNPERIEVSGKYQTVDQLLQYYVFIPAKEKVIHPRFLQLKNSLIACETVSQNRIVT
jgi:superfamily II DNA/RNA helicase